MNITSFSKECQNKELPYYAKPRVNYLKLDKYYKFLTLTVKRKVSTNGVKRYQIVRLSSKLQTRIVESLTTMEKIIPYTIAISSEPNDYVAMEFTTSIIHCLVNRLKEDWACLRIGNSKIEGEGKILLIYNIIPESDRLYQIRDIILQYPNHLKLVVIGGTTGLDYFDNYLRLPLSGALHVTGNILIKTIEKGIKYETEDNYPIFSKDFTSLAKIVEDNNAQQKLEPAPDS